MIILERREKIIEILESKRTATVKELARSVYASEASVRRDLEALELAGIVRKTYGGVVLEKNSRGVVPLEIRDSSQSAVKEKLAKRAAQLVRDGDTVFMDASSTVRRIIKHLGGKRNITVITNNARIFSECESPDITLICTGGEYNAKNLAFLGSGAESFVKRINADIFFFSSQAISDIGEISDSSERETSLRRAMLERAERRVFLCDGSKLSKKRPFVLCKREELTDIICDLPLPWESEG